MMIRVKRAGKKEKNEFIALAMKRDKKLRRAARKQYWYKKFTELINQHRLFIAYISNIPVGFMYYSEPFGPYVELVYVDPEQRRLGVAKSLFNKLELYLHNYGYKKLISSTEESNAVSIAMHRKLGFMPCGYIQRDLNGEKEVFFRRRI